MTQNTDQPVLMPNEITIAQVTEAWLTDYLSGNPKMKNPAYGAMAQIEGGKWVRITYNVTIEELDGPPPEVMAIMPTHGPQQ